MIYVRMLLSLVMLTLVACGGSSYDGGDGGGTPQQEEEGTVPTRPVAMVNPSLVSNMTVATNTSITNQNMIFNWDVANAPDAVHGQFVHLSDRCPVITDDTNGDGLIDEVELEQVAGNKIMALDSNLQNTREDTFPSGPAYSYNKEMAIQQFRQFVPVGRNFVIIIYGVDPNENIPSTFRRASNGPDHLAVPIACTFVNMAVIGT